MKQAPTTIRARIVRVMAAPVLVVALLGCGSSPTPEASVSTVEPSAPGTTTPRGTPAPNETTSSLVSSTTLVTTTAAAPETSAHGEVVSSTRLFPDPPRVPNGTCALLMLDIDASQLAAELTGRAVAGIRPTDGDGCEVTYYLPPPNPDQSIIAIARSTKSDKCPACCDRIFDDDEIAQEIDGGSTIYRDPTARDVDRVPASGRVTIIRPDELVIAVSTYGGGLTIEQLDAIALKLNAASAPPT